MSQSENCTSRSSEAIGSFATIWNVPDRRKALQSCNLWCSNWLRGFKAAFRCRASWRTPQGSKADRRCRAPAGCWHMASPEYVHAFNQGCRCALCARRSAAPATRKLRRGARPVWQGFSSPTEPAPCLCPPRRRSRRPPRCRPACIATTWSVSGAAAVVLARRWRMPGALGAGTAFRSDIDCWQHTAEHQEVHFSAYE